MDLVADIGGTNTRLAMAQDGQLVAGSIQSYLNDGFSGFDGPLNTYLDQANRPAISGICVAIAGPAHGETGKLTNRDWHFHIDALARMANAERAVLMNDLAALGYALPHLADNQVTELRPGAASGRRNGQSFVLGLGTGVNVAVSIAAGAAGHRVLEAEAGHVNLPSEVQARLDDAIGPQAAAAFFSTEELLAGRGLSALHACLSGQPAQPGHQIIASPDKTARQTVNLFATLAGLTLRELILFYLPLDGIYLNGGVFRGILSTASAPFLEALDAPHLMRDIIETPPIRLITDDAAALQGCAARLAQG